MLYGYIYITNSKANNHDIVVLKGDMDSSFVIMKKKDCIDKSEIIQNRVLKEFMKLQQILPWISGNSILFFTYNLRNMNIMLK